MVQFENFGMTQQVSQWGNKVKYVWSWFANDLFNKNTKSYHYFLDNKNKTQKHEYINFTLIPVLLIHTELLLCQKIQYNTRYKI